MLAALGRIHAAGEALPPLRAPDAFHPAWTAEANAAAVATLPARPPRELAALNAALTDLRLAAAPLFSPVCPLSGDPNPANWGLRGSGGLVLFDWERYCRGTPALDLAAVVPGLGTRETFAATAAAYLAATAGLVGAAGPDSGEAARDPASDPDPAKVARLAHEIALAKTWNAVELLAAAGGGSVPDGPTIDWLRGIFPAWVRTVAAGG